ncbi:4356_t:CDS:1, partial [Acaulospora colombiana]
MAIVSDYKQVITILNWFEYKTNRICFNTNIYQFKDTISENLKGFKEDIELAYLTSNTSTWDFINNVIKNSLDNNIPKK